MTTKPEVVAYATHHDEPMLFPDRKEAAAYCEDGEEPVALIRLSDYEALQDECKRLQAEHNEELFRVRQDRDIHFRELMQALEQVDALDAAIDHARQIEEEME